MVLVWRYFPSLEAVSAKFKVQGLGFRVFGLEPRVLGFRVYGLHRLQGPIFCNGTASQLQVDVW